MGLNTLEMQFSEKAAPYIAEAGGKIGGLNFLKATVPSLKDAILPVQVVNPDENLGELKVPEGDQGQYIIRGSHPMDFQGLVDVLTTKIGWEDIGGWVRDVQMQARRPAVMAYGKYENPAYYGRVFVGVQPYLDAQRGSIVEHPNIPGSYVMSFVPRDYQVGADSTNTGIYNSTKDQMTWLSGTPDEITGGAEDRARKAVEYYQAVEGSGIAKPGLSLQMEFLNAEQQMYVAQVRAFKRKEQADFSLDGDDRLVFGITPKEGIVLPAYLSTNGFVRGDQPDYSQPWAYLKPMEPLAGFSMADILRPKSEGQIEAEKLKFQPANLEAYLIGQSFSSQLNPSLEHNHFRVAQKAGITIFEGGYSGLGNRADFTKIFYENSMPDAHQELDKNIMSMVLMGMGTRSDVISQLFEGRTINDVRIVSDGRTATVEPITSQRQAF